MESEIKRIAKEEAGLDVSVNGIASARKIPEAKIDIVAVYFDCAATGEEKVGGDGRNGVFYDFRVRRSDGIIAAEKTKAENKNQNSG